MKELDPLEEFFRNKSEEVHPPYREEDWAALEKELDLLDIRRRFRRRTAWLAAASLLIISMLGYFTLQNHQRLNELSRTLGEALESEQQIPGQLIPDSERPADEALAGSDEESHRDSGDEPLAGLPPAEHPAVGGEIDSIGPTGGVSAPIIRYPQPGTPDSPHRTELAHSDGRMETGSVQPGRSLPLIPNDESVRNLLSSHPSLADGATRTVAGHRPVSAMDDISDRSIAAQDSGLPYRGATGMSHGSVRDGGIRVSAGVALSPDFSTVQNLSQFHQPGIRTGVVLELQLGERFALQTGFLPARVHYNARGEDQNAPVYWNEPSAPQRVTAACTLIDLPLTMKFELFQMERSRIYTTAGISSYYMISEQYRFQYNNSYNSREEQWSGRTDTMHWFSNAGISLGYELDLGSAVSLRAEPYLRLPVRKVGWGDVRLYSVGSFFSLHYRL